MPKPRRRYNPNTRPSIRQKIWKSMRILRKFSVADLCRTTPGATKANVQSFISRLYKHGIIQKNGSHRRGMPGEFQAYILVKDTVHIPVLDTGRHHKNAGNEDGIQTDHPQEVTP